MEFSPLHFSWREQNRVGSLHCVRFYFRLIDVGRQCLDCMRWEVLEKLSTPTSASRDRVGAASTVSKLEHEPLRIIVGTFNEGGNSDHRHQYWSPENYAVLPLMLQRCLKV
jgi:hypothetical protein